jgi:flagellar assembly protein FliH
MFESFSLYIVHDVFLTPGMTMKLLKDRKMIKKDFLRALERGDQVIGRAERIAGNKVDEARSEAEAIRLAARKDGFEAGRAEAAGIVLSAGQARDTLLARFEEDVIDLALAAAAMIVRKARELDPTVVGEVYRRALSMARTSGPVRVRVAPADHETALALMGRDDGPDWSVTILEDETVGPGGCVVESDCGVVDARIETQIEALRRALLHKPAVPEETKGP